MGLNEAWGTFLKSLKESGARSMADEIVKPTEPGGRAEGRRIEGEVTRADNARPRSMGAMDDPAVREFWARYNAGDFDPNAEEVYTPAKKDGPIPTGPMFVQHDAAHEAGRHDERKPINRGREALVGFERTYKEVAGVSSGVCHDESDVTERRAIKGKAARRDQAAGDRMAAENDPEYQDRWADYEPPDDPEDDLDERTLPQNYTDGLPQVSRAGRDQDRDERRMPPHTDRFGQARSDEKSYVDYFDQEGEDTGKAAQAKCPKCGQKQRLPHKLLRKEGKGQSRLAAVRCANKRCGESMAVAPPKGYTFGKPVTEAQRTFAYAFKRARNAGPAMPWE